LLKIQVMETRENIYTQHAENADWMNRLAFYKEEITILKELLAEIAQKNTSQETLKTVEHFQNQFIVQRNNLDELAHNIKMHEHKLEQEIDLNPVAVDHRKMEYHQAEKEFIDYFEANFNTLRQEFKTFAAQWM